MLELLDRQVTDIPIITTYLINITIMGPVPTFNIHLTNYCSRIQTHNLRLSSHQILVTVKKVSIGLIIVIIKIYDNNNYTIIIGFNQYSL